MKALSSLLVLLWLTSLPAVAVATDALNEALQRGLLAEEAQRDLPAAVAAYAEAVRTGDDLRAPMATALFRLAESQRRLGQTNEALGHYRRLLRETRDGVTRELNASQNISSQNPTGGDIPLLTGGK
ncbi:MAG: tetratricopeptide repeat protein [Verrucomicrobiota bacterium]